MIQNIFTQLFQFFKIQFRRGFLKQNKGEFIGDTYSDPWSDRNAS